MYAAGQGVEVDLAAAQRWRLQAALAGYGEAQPLAIEPKMMKWMFGSTQIKRNNMYIILYIIYCM